MRCSRRGSLDNDLELAMVKRLTAGILNLHQTLAQAPSVHLPRPMIAHWVITSAAYKGVRRPGAAGHASFRMIAGAAKTSQVVDPRCLRSARGCRMANAIWLSTR
jgi:hypothetical protein